MTTVLLLALGGAMGGVARVVIAEWMNTRLGGAFPWGILLVNITGAFAIGVLFGAVTDQLYWSFLAYGFLGSYTTVSSFGLQTQQLFQNAQPGAALAYTGLTLPGCLLAAGAGVWWMT